MSTQTYSYGKPLIYESESPVEQGTFQKGEYLKVVNHRFKGVLGHTNVPSARTMAYAYINEIANKGGKVHYIRVIRQEEIGPYGPFSVYIVEEAHIEGNAISVAVILALIILAGIIIVLYRPVIFKLAGVTPVDVIVSDWGVILVIGGLIVIMVFVAPYLKDMVSLIPKPR